MKFDNPVIVFGASVLGRIAKEILVENGRVIYGFLDDNPKLQGTGIDNIPVLGNTDDEQFLKLIGKQCEAVVAIDDTRVRRSLVRMLNTVKKVQPVNCISSQAFMARDVELGHGNLIDAGVRLASGVKLGSHCILRMGALVGVEARIEDFVQIGPGAVINEQVVIGEEAFVGTGVTIVAGVTVGKHSRVGAGSVVINSVKEKETVFGNPAGKLSIEK